MGLPLGLQMDLLRKEVVSALPMLREAPSPREIGQSQPS